MGRYLSALLVWVTLVTALTHTAWAKPASVTVFAAASTTNAMTDIAALYEKSRGQRVRLSFASSSTLAKQVDQGAPADIFISANPDWMNYLVTRGAVIKESRMDLLGNRLVFIAPAGSPNENLAVDKSLDLSPILSAGRLAMGDPDHVPAGMYGKKALENLGLWQEVQNRIARTKDVRAALVLVERAETPLGLVYATDAAISGRVRVAGVFPKENHPKIVYPAALVTGRPQARDFLAFLQSAPAARIFEQYGFTTP